MPLSLFDVITGRKRGGGSVGGEVLDGWLLFSGKVVDGGDWRERSVRRSRGAKAEMRCNCCMTTSLRLTASVGVWSPIFTNLVTAP